METELIDNKEVDAVLDDWVVADSSQDTSGRNLLLMPVVLLYTGFFLGPFFTFITSVLMARRKLSVRTALVLFGVSGTTWCMIGGFTIACNALLDWQYLQMGRAMFNLANGLACYIAVRRALAGHNVIPRTLYLTVGFAAILVGIFFVTPAKLVMVLGR